MSWGWKKWCLVGGALVGGALLTGGLIYFVAPAVGTTLTGSGATLALKLGLAAKSVGAATIVATKATAIGAAAIGGGVVGGAASGLTAFTIKVVEINEAKQEDRQAKNNVKDLKNQIEQRKICIENLEEQLEIIKEKNSKLQEEIETCKELGKTFTQYDELKDKKLERLKTKKTELKVINETQKNAITNLEEKITIQDTELKFFKAKDVKKDGDIQKFFHLYIQEPMRTNIELRERNKELERQLSIKKNT